MFTRKTIYIMLIAIGVLLIFIAGLLFWKNFAAPKIPISPAVNTGEAPASSIEAGKKATDNLTAEIKNLAAGNGAGKIAQVITVSRNGGNGSAASEQAVVVAPQSNPISVKTGEVLTRGGEQAADNAAPDGKRTGPLESAPIADVSKLPSGAVKLLITPKGFSPPEFTVSAGQAVVLAATSQNSVEVFKFDSPLLAAVVIGLMPDETRAIAFNAPVKIGEYVFYSDFGGHRQAGAVGKMIVK